MDTHRTRAHLLVRVAVVLVVVPVAFVVALPMWSEIEVAAVGQVLGLAGVDATRVDHQLLLTGDRGTLVLIVIGWCSSCAPVLAVVAAARVLPGARRRRVGSAFAASVLLVVGPVLFASSRGWNSHRPPAPQAILPRPAGPAYAPLRHAQPGASWHGPPLS
mgnify:CR=1 FL=1